MQNESLLYSLEKKVKNNNFKRKIKIFVAFAMVMVLLFILYFGFVVNKIVITICEASVQNLATSSINNTVYESLKRNDINYNNLIDITKNDNGDVTLITANAFNINSLSNLIAIETQKKLDAKSKLGVSIPIGTCTGITFLSGKGSDINITILPIGSVLCSFSTEFTQAGINQTNHKIFINVETEINVALPINNRRIVTSAKILVAENIITGDVPSTYLNISSLNDLLKV